MSEVPIPDDQKSMRQQPLDTPEFRAERDAYRRREREIDPEAFKQGADEARAEGKTFIPGVPYKVGESRRPTVRSKTLFVETGTRFNSVIGGQGEVLKIEGQYGFHDYTPPVVIYRVRDYKK